MTCSVDDCTKAVLARGLCSTHYSRLRTHGDPGLTMNDPMRRFAASVNTMNAACCWVWQKSTSRGYARFSVDGQHVYAHRWAYEQKYGPVPDGMQLDHFVCDNPSCVNPDHVRPTTARENVLRGNAASAVRARQTACVNGHPFDARNTYIRPDGARTCKACRAVAQQRFLAKQVAS